MEWRDLPTSALTNDQCSPQKSNWTSNCPAALPFRPARLPFCVEQHRGLQEKLEQPIEKNENTTSNQTELLNALNVEFVV
jgi:hypothetical protein